MGYKRSNIRVPCVGKVSIKNSNGISLSATLIDISENGLGISGYSVQPSDRISSIEVKRLGYGRLNFTGRLAHTYKNTAGFQITSISPENKKKLKNIIKDFRGTELAIQQLDQIISVH